MGTISSQYSDALIYDVFGVVSGSATPVQFPNEPCGMVRFKTDPDNNEDFFIGHNANNVLFPMDAGDDTGWVSTNNLNRYWYSNVSGSAEYLYWWLQR